MSYRFMFISLIKREDGAAFFETPYFTRSYLECPPSPDNPRKFLFLETSSDNPDFFMKKY